MKSIRRSGLFGMLTLVGALVGATGCVEDNGSLRAPEAADGTAASPLAEADPAEGGDAAPGPRGPHGMRHHGPPGPDHLIRAALHELELTDAQRTAVESALEGLRSGRKAPGPQDRTAFTALADAVRAGKVDPAAVLARVGDVDRRFEEHRTALAGALQTLHTTLTKEQRRELVDALAQRMAEHGPKGDHRGARGKGARGPEGAMRGPEGGMRGPGGPGLHGPLGHLLGGLDLSDEQRASIESALEAQRPEAADMKAMKQRFEARRAEMRARIEGFAGDSFDAKAFLAPPDGAEARGPKGHLDRMVNALAVVVPLLEPEQREALATRLEEGPRHMGRPGGRRGGKGR